MGDRLCRICKKIFTPADIENFRSITGQVTGVGRTELFVDKKSNAAHELYSEKRTQRELLKQKVVGETYTVVKPDELRPQPVEELRPPKLEWVAPPDEWFEAIVEFFSDRGYLIAYLVEDGIGPDDFERKRVFTPSRVIAGFSKIQTEDRLLLRLAPTRRPGGACRYEAIEGVRKSVPDAIQVIENPHATLGDLISAELPTEK